MGPKISGGMTESEYQQLLLDERQFQSEQEELRRNRAMEDEAQRRLDDEADRERLKAEELQELADLDEAEEELLLEVESSSQSPKALTVDFFGSLARGSVNPEVA